MWRKECIERLRGKTGIFIWIGTGRRKEGGKEGGKEERKEGKRIRERKDN